MVRWQDVVGIGVAVIGGMVAVAISGWEYTSLKGIALFLATAVVGGALVGSILRMVARRAATEDDQA